MNYELKIRIDETSLNLIKAESVLMGLTVSEFVRKAVRNILLNVHAYAEEEGS